MDWRIDRLNLLQFIHLDQTALSNQQKTIIATASGRKHANYVVSSQRACAWTCQFLRVATRLVRKQGGSSSRSVLSSHHGNPGQPNLACHFMLLTVLTGTVYFAESNLRSGCWRTSKGRKRGFPSNITSPQKQYYPFNSPPPRRHMTEISGRGLSQVSDRGLSQSCHILLEIPDGTPEPCWHTT